MSDKQSSDFVLVENEQDKEDESTTESQDESDLQDQATVNIIFHDSTGKDISMSNNNTETTPTTLQQRQLDVNITQSTEDEQCRARLKRLEWTVSQFANHLYDLKQLRNELKRKEKIMSSPAAKRQHDPRQPPPQPVLRPIDEVYPFATFSAHQGSSSSPNAPAIRANSVFADPAPQNNNTTSTKHTETPPAQNGTITPGAMVNLVMILRDLRQARDSLMALILVLKQVLDTGLKFSTVTMFIAYLCHAILWKSYTAFVIIGHVFALLSAFQFIAAKSLESHSANVKLHFGEI